MWNVSGVHFTSEKRILTALPKTLTGSPRGYNGSIRSPLMPFFFTSLPATPPFCISRSEERLQSSPLHCVQSAASSPEAGYSPETTGPMQLCFHQLQHLPSVHQRPAASHFHFILHPWLLIQLHRLSHFLLR